MTHHRMHVLIRRELLHTHIKGLYQYWWVVRVLAGQPGHEQLLAEARLRTYQEAMWASERMERNYWRSQGPQAEKVAR